MVQHAHAYRAFGIDFQSALPMPEMRVGNEGTAIPVEISHGLAAAPEGALVVDTGVRAGPGVFWMEVPGTVRLRVEDGRRMIVELAEGASESAARAYLLGSGLGAVLHQRGLLPIHASAVEIDGKAYAFAGHSGAGKSTLALALTRRGHRLLCDDIVAVDTSGPEPRCWPGLINVKLWGETLAANGLSAEGLEQVLPSLDKYRMPLTALADDRATELGGLFGLASLAADRCAAIAPMGGADAAGLLVANTFRGQLVGPMQRNGAHFGQCVALARQIPVALFERPWSLTRSEDCCALIEQTIMRLRTARRQSYG